MIRKLITTISLVLIMLLSYAQGWTLQNPLPTFQNILDVSFPSVDTGYIVGDQTLMRTIDGGLTWESLPKHALLEGKQISNVNFISNNKGFIGNGRCLFTTVDAGLTWTYQVIHLWGDVKGSYFYNDTLGFVIGRYSLLSKTADGGQSWQNISFNTNEEILYDVIKFANPQTGYISGYGGLNPEEPVLKRSDDGGLTWINVNVPSEVKYITSMEVLGPDDIWIGAGTFPAGPYSFYAPAFHSEDGGNSWTTHILGYSNDSYYGTESMQFFDSLTGYVLNYGHFYSTNDGGQTWNDKPFSIFNESFENFSCPNPDVCVVVGYGPALRKTIDAGENFEDLITGNNYVNYSVYFKDSLNGFAGGVKSMGSFINYTNDGGKTWQDSYLDLTLDSISDPPWFHYYNIFDIAFMTETTGWAVFRGNVIYKTTDGGLNWHIGSTGIEKYVKWLSIPDDHTIFISGSTCSVIKSTDAGNSWEDVSPPVTGYTTCCRSVFTDSLTGYLPAVNSMELGVMFKTEDGGVTWSEIHYGSSGTIVSISFDDNLNGIIGLNDKSIRFTSDGGVTWNTSSVYLPQNATYLKMVDSKTAIATIDGDYMAISHNGGESFTAVYEGSLYWPWLYQRTTATCFIDETIGWSASNSGMIMRFDLLATGIDQTGNSMNSEEVLFYPNPANEVINIVAKSYTNLQIYDCHGRIVHSQPFMENSQVNISHLTSGIFIVSLVAKNGRKQQKLIKW